MDSHFAINGTTIGIGGYTCTRCGTLVPGDGSGHVCNANCFPSTYVTYTPALDRSAEILSELVRIRTVLERVFAPINHGPASE